MTDDPGIAGLAAGLAEARRTGHYHYTRRPWPATYQDATPADLATALAATPPVADLLRKAAAFDGLVEALRAIDALPVHRYRRNGCASPDPWLRQREVRRIARAALAAATGGTE